VKSQRHHADGFIVLTELFLGPHSLIVVYRIVAGTRSEAGGGTSLRNDGCHLSGHCFTSVSSPPSITTLITNLEASSAPTKLMPCLQHQTCLAV
jgi:hypothetical protein